MNHIYRIVWNAAHGTWVAVAEFASAHTRSASRSATVGATAATLAGLICGWSNDALADGSVVTANTATSSYVAPNGVTVVDIARSNTAGLSHNQFLQYNVDSKGLVLNNGNADQVARQSQLAGLVAANPNLTSQAALILNEVVSNNRSVLAGFTEVLGGKADVVIANPYGITCSGCGFINTDHVTLSTGRPEIGGDGSLAALNVSSGDILVNGAGLNGSNQQLLDLVTRSLRLEAPVNATELTVVTGLNRWDALTRAVTASVAAEGAAPTRAIDSAVLGGMYADRIRLIATEAGVGVRMLGDAAANGTDFTLDSTGAVELRGKLSAQQDIHITSTAPALGLHGAVLGAGRDIALNSTGAALLEGGELYASRNLNLNAASLTDSANLYSGGAMALLATAGDLDLGTATVLTQGNVDLSASGVIRTSASVSQGLESTHGDITLNAGGGVNNAGSVSADAGRLTLRANGLDNSGALYAASGLDIADRNGGGSGDLTNSGTLYTDGALSLQAANASNTTSGWIQVKDGSQVQLASLDNAGTWLLSTSTGAADNLTVSGLLNNSGKLQSARAWGLQANRVDNAGSLIATGDLAVRTSNGYSNQTNAILQSDAALSLDGGNGALVNDSNALILATRLDLQANGSLSNAGNMEASSGNLTLRVNGLGNSGSIHAAGGLDLADRIGGGSSDLSNSGSLTTDGTLTLRAAVASNTLSGRIQVGDYSQVWLSSLGNAGTWLLSGASGTPADSVTVSGLLGNSGTLQSARGLALQTGSVDNAGKLLAVGDLTVSATNGYTNQAGASLQSGAALSVDSGSGALVNSANALILAMNLDLNANADLGNAGSVLAKAGGLTVRANRFINSGVMSSTGGFEITDRQGAASGDLTNSGTLYTDGVLSVQAASARNTDGGWIQAAQNSQVQLASLTNAGTWLLSSVAGNVADSLQVSGDLSNSGNLFSVGDLNLTASQSYSSTSGALLQSGGHLSLTTGSFNNADQARILSASLDLTATNSFSNAGKVSADAGRLLLTASRATNIGELYAASQLDINTSGNLDNSGSIYSDGSLGLSTVDASNSASGWVQAKTGSELQVSSLSNAGTWLLSTGPGVTDSLQVTASLNNTGLLQSAHALTATADRVTNSGSLIAVGDFTLSATSSYDNQAGALLQSAGHLRLDSSALSNAAAAQMLATNLDLTSTGSFSNDGILSADGGSLTMRVNGLDNKGSIYGATGLDMADYLGAGSSDLTNSGNLYSDGVFSVKAADVSNTASGWIQISSDSAVQAASLNNAGTWVLSSVTSATDTLSVSASVNNSGLLQSAGALNLTSATLGNAASGQMLAASQSLSVTGSASNAGMISADSDSLDITAAGLDNSGQMYGTTGLDINLASHDLGNSGGIYTDGVFTLHASKASNLVSQTASGWIQAQAGSQVTLASFDNQGTWLLSGSVGSVADSLTVSGELLNSGTLYASQALNVEANTVVNSGRFTAAGNLGLVLSGADAAGYALYNQSGATLGSGQTLNIDGGAQGLYNAAGLLPVAPAVVDPTVPPVQPIPAGLITGDRLALHNFASLDNDGRLQGGSAADSLVEVSGQITNNGDILMATSLGGGGNLNANLIVNNANINSLGALTMTVGTRLDNNVVTSVDGPVIGTISANGNITLQGGSASTYTINNYGRVQSGGLLSIAGNQGGNQVGLTIRTGAVVLGQSVDINSLGIGIENGGELSSLGDMTVRTDSLLSRGVNSRILAVTDGVGTADIAVSNAFINNGLVYSGDKLLFSALSIRNEATAAFGAQDDATLTATGSNISNYGALWSAGVLTTRAANYVGNYGGTLDGPGGTLDAGLGIVIESANFVNYSTINSRGDVTIKADVIRNETSDTGTTAAGWDWVYSDMVINVNSGNAEWTRTLKYKGGDPFKPQIIGAGTVTLSDFTTGTNLRATIAGNTVILRGKAGASPTPTFINNALGSPMESYGDNIDDYLHWTSVVEPYFGGTYSAWSYANLNGAHVSSLLNQTAPGNGAGVYAVYADFGGFALGNGGAPQGPSTTTHDPKAANTDLATATAKSIGQGGAPRDITSVTDGENPAEPKDAQTGTPDTPIDATSYEPPAPVDGSANQPATGQDQTGGSALPSLPYTSPGGATPLTGIQFGGINFSLPSNPNGYFVTTQNPNAHYLIETNPLYLSVPGGAGGLSSDYLATQLGYMPDTLLKRLGDGSYETYLIQQELIAQTGRNLLQGYDSSAAQLKQLMDNAVSESAALGLVFGAAPSETQLASLKTDMVWMVESTVSGQRVLAPVVYLSAQTRASILHGSVIQADHLYMEIDGLTNTAGTISGGKTLSVVSVGNITNLSGTITGGNVSLKSINGSIVNQRLGLKGGVGNGTNPAGTISATNNLTLAAGREIINDRSKIDAGGKLTMIGQGDISNLSGKISGGEIAMKSSTGNIVNKTLSGGNKQTVLGDTATITAKTDLTLIAAKKIDVIGAQVKAGGDVYLDAGDGISFDTIEKRSSSASNSQTDGFLYSKKTSTQTTQIEQVKSGLDVGGTLVAKSGKDITFAGTDVSVGGDAVLRAKGDVNVIARANKTITNSQTKESGLGVGGGVWGDSSTTTDKTVSKNVGSSFKVGGSADIKTEGDVNLQGSKMKIAGDANIDAKNINVLDGLDKEETHSHTTTTTILRVTAGTGSADSATSAKASGKSEKNLIDGMSSADASAKAGGQGGLEFLATEDTVVDASRSKSVGSELSVGGNARLKASKNITIQGSTVDVGGDTEIDADKVNLLAGRDVNTSKTKTSTVSIGLMGSSNNEAGAGVQAAGNGDLVAGAPSGNLGAGAQVGAKSQTGLVLFQHEDKTTEESEVVNHGASLTTGGNLKVRAKELGLQGSKLAAQGDVDVKADTIKLSTAEDSKTSKTTATRTSIGLMAESDNSASAAAAAQGGVKNLVPTASVGADAVSNNKLDLLRVEATTDSSRETKNQGSAISAGGSMKVSADKLEVKGSSLDAGGDMDLRAKDMKFEAADDINEKKHSVSTTTAGLYGEAGTGAQASAQVNANADASAEIGMGYQLSHKVQTETEGGSKAVTSSIKAGGNLKREAGGGITDVGTQIEVGGNMSQSAATITSKAAQDTSYSSSSSETHTGKVGMYAGASAQAGVGSGAGYDASVGGRVSYANEQEAATSAGSKAVVSNIKVGGGFSSKSSAKTSLEGTHIETGGDASLSAGSLDYKAARDTQTDTSSTTEAGGVVSVNVNAESVVGGSASASYTNSEGRSVDSKAVVGKLKSGGKLSIKTTGDASFEGTDLSSKGDAAIQVGGKADFAAAKDTLTTTDREIDASFSVGMSTGGSAKKSGGKSETAGMFEVGGGYSQSATNKVTGKAASVSSGGNLTVSSGGDIRLEGSNLSGKGATRVDAGGDLKMEAIRDTEKTDGFGVSAKLGGAGSKSSSGTAGAGSSMSPGEGTAGLGGAYTSTEDVTVKGGTISGGSSLAVTSGKNMSLENATLTAGNGQTEVKAGGSLSKTEAKDSSSGVAIGAQVEISVKKKEKKEDTTTPPVTTPPPVPPKKGTTTTPPPLPPKKGTTGTPPPVPPKKGTTVTPPPLPPKKP